MKALFAILIIASLVFNGALSQDSLVLLQDLHFHSDAERAVFKDHFAGNNNLFELFMANGKHTDSAGIAIYSQEYFNYVKSFDSGKFHSRTRQKKVKLLYSEIHKKYLTKYEEFNRFENIFRSGYYNCVSGTALLGLAFSNLDIPFSVVEKPGHVYLIAYPNEDRIVVEATTPAASFRTISHEFKMNYLRILKEQKIISQAEYNTSDKNGLFDKHYFGENIINLGQLAGIQYMNDGIYLMDEQRYLEAFQQFEKGYLLYPCERSSILLTLAAKSAFEKQEDKGLTHASLLAKISRYKHDGITNEMIQQEFFQVTNQLLFKAGKKEKLDEYYQFFRKELSDTVLTADIDFLYHYENGRLLYNQARYKEALEFAEQALDLQESNQDAHTLFIGSLAYSLRNAPVPEVTTSLEKYAATYPVMLKNNNFNEMLLNSYLIQFERAFREADYVSGEKFRATFEKFQRDRGGSQNDHLVGSAYSAAALYYFRKGQSSKAKNTIIRGLEIAPENYDLKMRLKMLQ